MADPKPPTEAIVLAHVILSDGVGPSAFPDRLPDDKATVSSPGLLICAEPSKSGIAINVGRCPTDDNPTGAGFPAEIVE